MTEAPPVPDLTDLLKDSPSNWGKWGEDDEVGSLNDLGQEQALAALRLVTSGKTFTLQRLIGDPKGGPVYPGVLQYADDKINAFLQGSTQYDALGHVWYGGKIWNGYDVRTTIGRLDRASVEPIAQPGVVGRAVLLDMARFLGKATLDKGETFTHEDLQSCAAKQGVTIEKRDILIIRTNLSQLFFEQGEAFYEGCNEPGLVYSPELVQCFADMEILNLVADTIADEVTTDPDNGVALVPHNALMRDLGIRLTDIADLEKLATDCAEDGQYAFRYVAAPLNVALDRGFPVNPVVIK